MSKFIKLIASQGSLNPLRHPNNIITPNHQTATEPPTSLFIGNFYLGEEVLQVEFQRALAKGSFTQLLELKSLVANISASLNLYEINSENFRKKFKIIFQHH
jgi:hypothetical protein